MKNNTHENLSQSRAKSGDIQDAAGQPAAPKLTRAQRSQQNKLLKAKTQVQEIALGDKAPFKTVIVPAAGEGEMLPEKLRRPSATAKQATAVAKGKGKRISAETERDGAGRPVEWTEAEGDAICAWISQGKSLSSYCRETGRHHSTVYRWLRERAEFSARYALAHEDRADTLVDEMLDIADTAADDASIEGVSAAKLRVETRKWIAMKLRASKYGDKVEVKQTGAVSINIGINSKAPKFTPELVEEVTPRIAQPGKN